MRLYRVLLLASVGLSGSSVAWGQETELDARRSADDFHGPTIVVTAGGLERLDMLAGTSVVDGDELQRNLSGQIGEVLARTPGVSATSFSPGASRPVLRGLQGDRVRVLVDGLGAIDASNVSADHAVTIEPLTAERIEVLRGPAGLLYGSSAIGGAVNVIDRRIPLRVPQEPVHFDAAVGVDSAYDLREAAASLDIPLAGDFAFHVDGSFRRTNDVEIPGFVLADPLRQELLDHAAEEPDEAEELLLAATRRGLLPNSATETKTAGAGLSWFGNGVSLGASAGYYETNYGVPMRPGVHHHHDEDEDHDHDHAHEHGDEPVTIGLEQFRADLRGSVDLGGFFEEARTRWGYSDYRHVEYEGDEIGTTFLVEGIEGRLELIQREQGGWRGSIGGQFTSRDFEAIGPEAFVPPNATRTWGLFTLQEIDLTPFQVEFGGRYERTDVKASTLGLSRGFDSISGALGIAYSPAEGVRVGVNGSRTARAPSAEELFANGPHIATQQFEIGRHDLVQETAWGLEGYARANVHGSDLGLTVYRTWFDDFIFLQTDGSEQDGLPVFRHTQQGANFFGMEAEASVPLFRSLGFTWIADLQGDYVRATLADGSPVPRIPPLSLLGALELQSDRLDARAEVQWFDEQDRVAPLEAPTDGFTHVNISLAWRPLRGGNNVTVMLQANNLLDEEGRRHASFTKDFVPLAGRNLKLSVRTSF